MSALRNDVVAWLRYAKNDIGVAEREMKAHRNPRLRPYEVILHHCHQCAEKVLKCYLLQYAGQYPFHHKLDELLLLCADINNKFNNNRLEDHCLWLNSFWNVKYPDFTLSIDATTAKRGINSAKRIYDFVVQQLSIDTK